ncbi:MAG TPA: MaoC/PaaZ C-terminal domain-containing protein [Candidatus Binataceae bacterium]|jgi:acyl dehydratase|nr:MaoC/PaaZ C-terminal domain-containing protein [Candidatus Binataceae bacterium]
MRYEDVNIGDALGPSEMYLSKDQVRTYAKAMGMLAPRFTDDELARKEGLPGMITPGNMSLAILGKLVTDWIGESGARMTRLGVTYRQPVLPDHTIALNGFVTHKNDADRSVEMDIWIESDEAERLVIGTATVQFPA